MAVWFSEHRDTATLGLSLPGRYFFNKKFLAAVSLQHRYILTTPNTEEMPTLLKGSLICGEWHQRQARQPSPTGQSLMQNQSTQFWKLLRNCPRGIILGRDFRTIHMAQELEHRVWAGARWEGGKTRNTRLQWASSCASASKWNCRWFSPVITGLRSGRFVTAHYKIRNFNNVENHFCKALLELRNSYKVPSSLISESYWRAD